MRADYDQPCFHSSEISFQGLLPLDQLAESNLYPFFYRNLTIRFSQILTLCWDNFAFHR